MLLGRRRRVRVRGDSMLPLLRPGDLLLLDQRAYRQQPPQKDDIVVAWHPHERQLIVKRVGSLTAEGAVVLTSDNPVGSDSRQFGAIARTEILGRVTSCSRLKV